LILKPRGAAAGSQNYPFYFSGAPFFVLVNMATSCFRRYEGTMRESLDSSTSALRIRIPSIEPTRSGLLMDGDRERHGLFRARPLQRWGQRAQRRHQHTASYPDDF